MFGYFLAICWLFWLFWLFENSNSQEIAKIILLFVSFLWNIWLFGHYFHVFLIFGADGNPLCFLGKFSYCCRTVLSLQWENCATCLALHCYRSQRTLLRAWEAFATGVGELWHECKRTLAQQQQCSAKRASHKKNFSSFFRG